MFSLTYKTYLPSYRNNAKYRTVRNLRFVESTFDYKVMRDWSFVASGTRRRVRILRTIELADRVTNLDSFTFNLIREEEEEKEE